MKQGRSLVSSFILPPDLQRARSGREGRMKMKMEMMKTSLRLWSPLRAFLRVFASSRSLLIAVSIAADLACTGALWGAPIAPPSAADERLTIDLVAAEPDIVTPTGLATDARGRVWVIE